LDDDWLAHALDAGRAKEFHAARRLAAFAACDCRKYPSEKNCTVSIAADWKPPCSMLSPCSHTDGPQLREMIGQAIQQESAVAA